VRYRKELRVAALVVLGSLWATACVATSTTAERTDPAPSPSANSAPEAGPGAVDQLTIRPEGPMEGYDRELFGRWVDTDDNGCDTRCEVLARQEIAGLPGLDGQGWESIYDAYMTDDPSELDVDHVVALGEAWRSGASTWSEDRRRDFANDLETGALVAVTASTNRSKGDSDPATWQPPSQAAWCWYGEAWVSTKLRWGLTADADEARALTNMADRC
jgi:hypothetical protein